MASDTKKLSVKEFKMWLQGVEEMQEENWTPDARQWSRIREKIDQIADAPAANENYVAYRAVPAGGNAAFPPTVFPPLDGTPPVSPGAGAPVPQPSALNSTPTLPQPPRTAVTPSGMPVALSNNPSKPAKMPDIDTSNGKPYTTPFA